MVQTCSNNISSRISPIFHGNLPCRCPSMATTPAGYLSEALEAMTAAKSGLAIRKVGCLWTRNSSGSFIPMIWRYSKISQAPSIYINIPLAYIYIWVNYNTSPTWIKAIWGWFPLLTMISSEGEQWGRYNIPELWSTGHLLRPHRSSAMLRLCQPLGKALPLALESSTLDKSPARIRKGPGFFGPLP